MEYRVSPTPEVHPTVSYTEGMYNVPRHQALAEGYSDAELRAHVIRSNVDMRNRIVTWQLKLFAVLSLGALGLIYGVALGKMVISEKVIFALLGATASQAATMLLTVIKSLFPTNRPDKF